ncbi:GntR family transcriptional regulator [Methylobacterium variabile]|uniref:GntR family transcriptional regulator n=1 Tax=Methylobacterium variabile TaxID=298794 RepID=UPI0009FB3787|nr:GntR family transcriptional regulator [Methylobacterium variabile]
MSNACSRHLIAPRGTWQSSPGRRSWRGGIRRGSTPITAVDDARQREPSGAGGAARLHAQAFDVLAERVRTGRLPAGTRLLESRVAAEFGVSRAPVRQALAALAEAGLVSRGEGRGYVVRTVDAGADDAAAAAAPVRLSSTASWERIYGEVELNIVSRTALSAWRVVEADLAKHHGVSRTVAREVVARLHQRGVIRKDDRSRWYAPGLTPGYVAELYELRWTLEPLALAKAAPLVPRHVVAGARARIEAAVAHADALDGPALDALEADLHGTILGYCPQRTLLDAVRLYQSLLVAHSFLYRWNPAPYPTEPFLPEHLQILRALDAGDTAHATVALEAHLRASLARANARLQAVKRGSRPDPLPYLKPLPG